MDATKHWFQNNKRLAECIVLFVYFTINALINATTEVMHEVRHQRDTFSHWEPFVWEFSSAYATVLLIPFIAWYTRKYRWQWQAIVKSFTHLLLAGVLFCLLHVALMVFFRELVYWFTPSEYNFATNLSSLLFELVYEMRKDIWSFFFFTIAIEVYRYAVTQWLGDASPIQELSEPDDENSQDTLPEKLLVRKLGKEFLIRTRHIQWAESSGNYLNLHVDNSEYPMRTTLSDFVDKTVPYGFVRIHRSYIINPEYIEHIETLPSGDGEIQMRSGKVLRLSRRYKQSFELSVTGLLVGNS